MIGQAELAIGLQTLSAFVRNDENLETQVRRCMANVERCAWMSHDEDAQFKIAVGAVMHHHGPNSEEWVKLERSLQQCSALAALLSGVPVDVEHIPQHDDTVPLFGWWNTRAEWVPPEDRKDD